jgi:hypothetical protein
VEVESAKNSNIGGTYLLKTLFSPFLLVVIILLSGCQANVDDITFVEEKEEAEQNTTSTDKTKEITESNLRKELILDIERPNQEPLHLTIDEQIPILTSYLEQFDEPKKEINRIRSNYLFSKNQRDYFLLSYSCGTKLCNQLLLEYNRGTIQSFKVSEESFLQNSKLNNDYIAFLFGRNEDSEVLRNQVVIINLKDFQKISPPEDLKVLESFEYPIPIIEWKDGALISTIADIDDTSYEAIKEWYKNNQEPIQQLKWKTQ